MKISFIIKSYKDKLRATYTLLMFLVLISLSTFLYYQMNNAVKPIIGNIGINVVKGEAQYFGERFNNQRNIVEIFASTQAFKTGDLLVIEKEIDNQMLRYGDALISMKFKAVTGEEYDYNPKNIQMTKNYEKELLDSGKVTLPTQIAFDENLSEYIAFTGTKVMDHNGDIKGMLIINSGIKQFISAIEKTNIDPLSEIWIFDSKGDAIIDPNKRNRCIYDVESFRKQIITKPSGEVKMTTPKGDVSYLVYSQIPNTQGLYLAKGMDHKDFPKAMQSLVFIIFGGIIFALFFIFAIANKMTNFVTKPLTLMVEIIQNSDDTHFIEMPNTLKTSKDEIGILANTIDEMARNIRNNVKALNCQIKERKKAEEHLIVLNDELECRVTERTLALMNVTNSLAVSEDRFRTAMQTAHIGLYDLDCTQDKLVVNGVFLNLIHAPDYKNGLIKESDWVQYNDKWTDVIYEEDVLGMNQFCEHQLPEGIEEAYTEFRLKEDPDIWLSLIGQAVKKDETGKIIRFIAVLQNISERKRTEVELKAAKEAAEEASLAKSQFLANMSHEIRTPMNAIMGLTHLIDQSDLNDSQKNYVSKIEGSSRTLLGIINDILDFSKIEAGKLEIENIKFNLDKILENVSNLYTASATHKGIDINFDRGEAVPNILIGDPLRLEQILSNLTTNAIKFTSKGEVSIAVRIALETENKVNLYFSVTDTGIGLTKEQIDKLFTAFTQADGSMTRKYGGTGLGLTISKQLVELMNGEIWAESNYGEGAAFKFTITFDKVSDIVPPSYLENSYLKEKKVLVIDHNKTSLKIIVRMLRSFSLEVTAIRDPFEAIEWLEKEIVDLLVIDFNLPELSGIDLYKKLVANTELKVPKTIFISATGRESYYNQVNQLGVKNFLVKPISQSLMFDAVMNALKGTAISEETKDNRGESQIKYQSMLVNKRILLVEDNDINQLVAKDILEEVGINVSIANNGEEAIKYIRANKFDAVLMDVQMPIMDGYEATKMLRKTYSSSELPIIAMTANALKGDRERSIESGMNDYISKPIYPEILFETLVKWLYGKRVKSSENPIFENPIKEDLHKKFVILDFEKTLVRLGHKEDFYKDLLKRYKDNYSNIVKELSERIIKKQYDETKSFIHSLKSVTGNIGAMKLNHFITQFEEQYESYNEEVIKEKLEMFSALNQELLKAIIKVISLDDPEKKHLNSPLDFTKGLEKLIIVLKKARAKEIKESMNDLVTNNKDERFMTQINEIKKLVERYRFKEAKVMAEELMDVLKETSNG